jgi:hypothetical protein
MWILQLYGPSQDFPKRRFPLDGIDANYLRRELGLPSSNPIFDSFPMSFSQAQRVARHVGVEVPNSVGDWYLEYEALRSEKPS